MSSMMSNIVPNNAEAYHLLHKGILALARAEQHGMRIDTDYCDRKSQELDKQIADLSHSFEKSDLFKKWQKKYGSRVNTNSSAQLGDILYNVLGYSAGNKTKTGKGKTDEESLRQLKLPEIDILLQMRKLQKIKVTYLNAFSREQVDGFLHPFFHLHSAVTYRSTSDSPNFQNIPIRSKEANEIVRSAIFPREEHQLLEVDYSGIEVRVGQCYHHDPKMLAYIEDPTTDMHRDMAQQIFGFKNIDKSIFSQKTLRQAAKNGFVFPQFYGDYFKNCAENIACHWCNLTKGKWKKGQGIVLEDDYHISDHLREKLNITNYDDFEEHIKQIENHFWNKRFKTYNKWRNDIWNDYQHTGKIATHTGFQASGIMRRNEAINFPIQGSAFHCLLWSFIQIDRISQEEQWETRAVGQIHDSIILDVHPKELEHVLHTLHDVMCIQVRKHWPWIIVPLEIEADICGIDKSWSTKKGYDINPFI